MKKALIIILPVIGFLLTLGGIYTLYFLQNNDSIINPINEIIEPPKPLLSYTFENLREAEISGGNLRLDRDIDETDEYISQMFYFDVPERPDSDGTKQVSGRANVPKEPGTYPVILMMRGFIPEASFFSGAGTQPSASQLAANGFITLAPDFLGFGESDATADDGFEGRFQTYTTAITLLEFVKELNNALEASYSGEIQADISKIGLWGHSNGGHIALSLLSITGKPLPTVLWNPVSKHFPYSILFYLDEYDDQGRGMRKYLASFEELYDVDEFSPPNYYHWITAPIQIHQGADDEEVPRWWSDELVELLEEEEIEVDYNVYQNADHNLAPAGWNLAVDNMIDFYTTQFEDE